MRTLTVKIYKFSELTEEAKTNAITNVGESYHDYNDFAEQSIDNCYLFEPPHEELIKLFGENFYNDLNKNSKYKDTPLIGNTRESIYFDTDRGYLNCISALDIKNTEYFLKWLGLNGALIEKVYYQIENEYSTTINFYPNDDEIILKDIEKEVLTKAKEKFDRHIRKVVKNIGENIDYYFSDEAITEDIEANEYEFLQDGTIFK